MRFKTTLIFVIGVILFCYLGNVALAFSCETHQLICERNYNYVGNCCKADQTKTPAMPYHHCADNATDCDARLKAIQYMGDADIKNHLLADSESPAHWYSLQSADHSKFEDCVNEYVKAGFEVWECTFDFVDKYGTARHLTINNGLIKPKPAPVITNVTDTVIEQVHEEIQQQNEEPKIGFIEKIMNWFKSLFKPKPKAIEPSCNFDGTCSSNLGETIDFCPQDCNINITNSSI